MPGSWAEDTKSEVALCPPRALLQPTLQVSAPSSLRQSPHSPSSVRAFGPHTASHQDGSSLCWLELSNQGCGAASPPSPNTPSPHTNGTRTSSCSYCSTTFHDSSGPTGSGPGPPQPHATPGHAKLHPSLPLQATPTWSAIPPLCPRPRSPTPHPKLS